MEISEINSKESDFSMSDLELLANKKKLQKSQPSNNISVSKSKTSLKIPASEKNSTSKRHYTKSYSDDTVYRERNIKKENKDPKIRNRKNTLLYNIDKLNELGDMSNIKLNMNCSLNEIQQEHNRISSNKQAIIAVSICKQSILLAVRGFEWANHNFDPVGVDLDGWSKSLDYSMQNHEFDDVIHELYEKYKGSETWSPEFKLVSLLVSSALMFNVNKRLQKMDFSDNSNIFSNIFNKMFPQQTPQQSPQQSPQQPQQQPDQQYYTQQHSQQQPTQQYYPQQPSQQFQNQFQQQFQHPTPPNMFRNQQPIIDDIHQSRSSDRQGDSDNTSDSPPKIKGPREKDINEIIKRMEESKQNVELESINIFNETEMPNEKTVTVKKKRGRKPKNLNNII